SVFYQNCLTPFFRANYGSIGQVSLGRGDQVRRPGVIICEGICKRIQESDFIVADVSVPNANVFYELGLAYGIGQKIIVIHHYRADFGRKMAEFFQGADCKCFSYHDLDPIRAEDFEVSNFIWRNQSVDSGQASAKPGMLLFEQELEQPSDPA